MNDIRTVATVYLSFTVAAVVCFYAVVKPAPVQGVSFGSDWRNVVHSVVVSY